MSHVAHHWISWQTNHILQATSYYYCSYCYTCDFDKKKKIDKNSICNRVILPSLGCPNSAKVPQNIKKVRKITLEERKVNLPEVVAFTILCNTFCSWVISAERACRVYAESNGLICGLALFKRNKKNFFMRWATMGHYTPDSDR